MKKEILEKAKKEAKKYRPELYKKHSELADIMQVHLQSLKNLI